MSTQAVTPTFWLLDNHSHWTAPLSDGQVSGHQAYMEHVVQAETLHLAACPGSAWSLDSPDGSLGRLTLPRGIAIDAQGIPYLRVGAYVLRHNPQRRQFERLPGIGGPGSAPRQLQAPIRITIAAHDLYVTERRFRRIQVFDLKTLALRHVWRFPRATGLDVAGNDCAVYILTTTGSHSCVYLHRPGRDARRCVLDVKDHYTRVLVDSDGRLYLYKPYPCELHVYDWHTAPLPPRRRLQRVQSVTDASEVRERFPEPAVIQEADRLFSMDSLHFDRTGRLVIPEMPRPMGLPRCAKEGWWLQTLDSNLYNCVWDKLEIDLDALPPGSQIVVSTHTHNAENNLLYDEVKGHITEQDGAFWDSCFSVSGALPKDSQPTGMNASIDGPLRSRKGRYIWLRLRLISDGFAQPVIRRIRAHYPRHSYLEYLPAIFQMEEENPQFLERFLAIIQTEFETLEHLLEELPAYYDPAAVPAGEPLKLLAGWLGLPLEHEWTAEQQRRLLMAYPGLLKRRGRLDAFRDMVRIYLANLAHLSPEAVGEFPIIIEGYRERNFVLGLGNNLRLGQAQPWLWSAAVVRRLQLEIFSTEGEVELRSVGKPPLDPLEQYAFRFHVFVPAAWVRSEDDRAMLCRVIEAEKPASTHYDLHLVEAQTMLEVQSTLGVDTILGPYPAARLMPAEQPAATRPLAYDSVLEGEPSGETVLHLAPGVYVGVDTQLS